MQKDRNQKKKVIAITIACILICLGLGTIAFYNIVLGGPATETVSLEDYSERLEHSINTDLRIFPQEIAESASDTEYYYYYRDTLFDPACQVFLRCQYSPEDYEGELERLQGIQERYQKKDENGGFASEDFEGEAYIYKLDDDSCYEYAVVNPQEREIAYVYLQFISEKNVKFDTQYLPLGYQL